LFTGWRMARSKRNKRGRASLALLAAVCLPLMAGCSLLPEEAQQEKLPEIRVPKISQKPEYPVKRSALEIKVNGSGKLMSAREDNLLFTQDNMRIAEVHVKAGDRVKKGQVLATLDTGNTVNQIRRKEIELEKSELNLKEMLREQDDPAKQQQRKLMLLDHELLLSDLEELRSVLADAKLTAPYDGTIVSFTAEKGDMARAYEKIGRIADQDDLVVAVQFSSGDLEKIAAGMDTIVSINTAGDHKGKVGRLPVDTGQQNAKTPDAYTLISLPALPEGVSHDTPLSASVIVERRENVLTIPVAALRKQNNRTYVIVSQADGSKGEVDVDIGVQTTTEVEIISGLEEGQKVVGK